MHGLTSKPLAVALLAVALGGGPAGAQSVTVPGISPAAPLVRAGEGATAPGGWIMREQAAERALQLGFSPAAAALLQELLAAPDTPATEKGRLQLDLVAAWLDQGRLDDAAEALAGCPEPHGPAFHLRAGLIAAYRRKLDAARAEAAQVRAEDLPAAERGWARFLEGMIAEAGGDLGRAQTAYEQALAAAVSEAQRARFSLEREKVKLLFGQPTEQQAAALARNVERYQGQRIGTSFVRQYATVLDALGRKPEAVALLQRQLQLVPGEERQELDDLRLLLGLIAGADSGVGRNALFGLLDGAVSREPQRMALQLLGRASAAGTARSEFRAKLDQLIAAPAPHPILEDLRVYRAEVELAEKNYGPAEEDAKTLLERFPGSQLKAQALGVLAGVAWELRRYRTAADYAAQLRTELPPGDARARLGVLVAEAYFRAGDFKSAADAYASAQADPPAGVAAGTLLFQRVLAEINAGRLDAAGALLDQAAAAPGIDAVSRWQAEWNLARALQVNDQTAPALARVTRLVGEPGAAALSADLAVRMAWLQARLAFESNALADAIRLVDALLARLAGPAAVALPANLKTDVASTSVLLKAQALLVSAKTRPAAAAEGLALLAQLRQEYPKTDAAVYSFVAEADYYAARYEIGEAQRLFTKLADDYRDNAYAPFALYEAALNAERRGQDAYYEDANRLIERLVTEYPQSELVFYARLKQGDLLRKLNLFGPAQRVYELLVNNYAQHQDVLLAQLALADCHLAQAATDSSHWESALTIYERLQDLPTAPADLRVEAGYKHGYALSRRGNPDRAQATWMLAVNTFLLDPAVAGELGKGRYWMSRILLGLGDLYERDAKLDQARRAYELLLQQNLPGQALARQQLARLGAGAAAGTVRPP